MSTPRPANANETSTAQALIGGAFGFMGIALFASASYADKVTDFALWWGNISASAAVGFFLGSIILGGIGLNFNITPGPKNAFNWQAIFGVFGVACLLVAAWLFAFSPKPESPKLDLAAVFDRITNLQATVATQRTEIAKFQKSSSDSDAAKLNTSDLLERIGNLEKLVAGQKSEIEDLQKATRP